MEAVYDAYESVCVNALRHHTDGGYCVSLSVIQAVFFTFTRSLSSHVCSTPRLLQLFKFTPLKREKASFYILMFRKRKEMTSHSKAVIRASLGVQGWNGFTRFWHCGTDVQLCDVSTRIMVLSTNKMSLIGVDIYIVPIRHHRCS